jgi:hypothetical protein
MNDETREFRKAIVKNVWSEIAQGKSREEACAKNDISVRTFIRYNNMFPELGQITITDLSNTVVEKLNKVKEIRATIIDELLNRVTDVTTMKTRDLLTLERRFKEFQTEIEAIVTTEPSSEEEEDDVPELPSGEEVEKEITNAVKSTVSSLPQPKLVKAIFEFSSTEVIDGNIKD